MPYSAIVAKIETRPHPNADRLCLGTCLGNQVIVRKDTPDGAIGVYFDTDGQLSEEFCKANDLIGYTDPETGERKGGFFTAKRNVRAQQFRGQRSDGFWAPLSFLSFTGYDISSLTEGATFTELNGIPICQKYFTPRSRRNQQRNGDALFPFFPNFFPHFDTEQFWQHAEYIPKGSIIYVTEKLHGTSGRFGRVPVAAPQKKTFLQRLWGRLPFGWANHHAKLSYAYHYLNGTRRTIVLEGGVGYYGKEQFRTNAVAGLTLHKGETLYYELVGYTENGKPIMPPHSTHKLTKHDPLAASLPLFVEYKYGCLPTECRLFIYRITHTNEDGDVVELPWPQVVRRAKELGLNTVPSLVPPILYDGAATKLRADVESLCAGTSCLDQTHFREGVCVRVEQPDGGTRIFKNKSFAFKVMEGIAKEDETYSDIEEAQ